MTKNFTLLSPHHASLNDWDFFRVSDWTTFPHVELSLTYFITTPSSVFMGDSFEEVYAMPKWASMQNLKAGRISTWLRSQIAGVGSPYIYIGIRGMGSTGIRLIPFFANNVWMRTRFTWWQGEDPEGEPATLVLRERYLDGEWLPPTLTYHHPMLPGLNRVGIGSTPQSVGYMRWWDNTIIEEWINEPCY